MANLPCNLVHSLLGGLDGREAWLTAMALKNFFLFSCLEPALYSRAVCVCVVCVGPFYDSTYHIGRHTYRGDTRCRLDPSSPEEKERRGAGVSLEVQ